MMVADGLPDIDADDGRRARNWRRNVLPEGSNKALEQFWTPSSGRRKVLIRLQHEMLTWLNRRARERHTNREAEIRRILRDAMAADGEDVSNIVVLYSTTNPGNRTERRHNGHSASKKT